ncbi:MAG TPA: signal recognition particle protein [Gemmatimonadetes bacterium]|nr:signal recognition particle protein [Gemmatimonadota bacterium]HCO13816.1 signal recognition particle protein [Gemmatimonadota bacterium]|tara:strand:+ start:2143 stop:3456 length:1314 start_codon:yes stop_codon:yes gene_type:complete
MFDELGEKLDGALKKLRQRGVLTEPMVKDGLREVRRVLLEADVNFRVTRDFLGRVQERALGEETLRAVSPGQQVVKIVHDELAHLFGEVRPAVEETLSGLTVVLIVGLQGVGKTTTAAKLARRFARDGKRPMLAACDLQRPAAIEQLQTLGGKIGVEVFKGEFGGDPVATALAARKHAVASNYSVLVVDTAGRLQIDETLMEELTRIREVLEPHEILLVADAMTGQEAVTIAKGFDDALGLTGIVMSKMDGDARGGAALSMRSVTGCPIKFLGVGEGIDDLDQANPTRLAGRILQMGDVVGLVERAQVAVDEEQQVQLQKQMMSGRFTLEDFLAAMSQIQRMGPLDQLMKLMPGTKRIKIPTANMNPKRFKHVEAIILSMTPQERQDPKILNGSRRARIAKGSGRSVAEVNRLLKQFKQMQKLMKQMRGMIGGSGIG